MALIYLGLTLRRPSQRRRWEELGEKRLYSAPYLVSDRSDLLERLAGRVLELPVLVPLPGHQRTGVTASHRHHHVGRAEELVGPGLGELLGDVDPDLGHRLDHVLVDLGSRLGTTRPGDGTIRRPDG